MKNIKQIRKLQESLSENVESNTEIRKLTTLVRSGLFDPSKLSMLKRALNKDNVKMSKVEREALLELLDRLLNIVLSNQGTYNKVKQSISEELSPDQDGEFSMARADLKTSISSAKKILEKLNGEGKLEAWLQSKITLASDYLSTAANYIDSGEANLEEEYVEINESSWKASKANMNIDINQIPPIIIMKRRGLRVFPDGQKVALYYADKINKFISVPFQSIGIGTDQLQEAKAFKDDDDKKVIRSKIKGKNLSPEYRASIDAKSGETRRNAMNLLASRKTASNTTPSTKIAMKAAKDVLNKTNSPIAALGTAIGGTIGSYARRKVSSDRTLANIKQKVLDKRKTYSTQEPKVNLNILSAAKKANAPGVKPAAGSEALSKKIIMKESYKRKLQELREARQYGAADAALDAASFLPGPAGSAASLASAGMSLSRGDYVGAGLDALGAIPLAGYLAKGAKAARVASKIAKTAKTGKELTSAEKAAKGAREVEKGAETAAKETKAAKSEPTDMTPKQEPAVKPEPKTEPANKAKEAETAAKETKAAKPSRFSRYGRKALGAAGAVGAGLVGAALSGAAGANSNSPNIKVPQSTGKTAFGGKDVQGIDPFKTERPTLTSLDRRDQIINRKASQAMFKEGLGSSIMSGLRKTGKFARKTGAGLADIAANMDTSGSSTAPNIKVPQNTGKVAFGGRDIQGVNPFTKQKQSITSLDRRDQIINRKASQAMIKESDTKFGALKTISESEDTYALQYEDGNVNVSGKMATKLLEVYGSLNADNKKVVQEMINKDKNSFMKFANFALGK